MKNDVSFKRRRLTFRGFTLAELIVVIAILAILATIGLLSLWWYSQDAAESAIKANMRSVVSAISSEAAISWNSARYYVIHDSDYALSWAFAYVDGQSLPLTWGDIGNAPTDSNYTAGRPNYAKLKLDPNKFRISALLNANGTDTAHASFDASHPMAAGADFLTTGGGGKKRMASYLQTAYVSPVTRIASVSGDFPTTGAPPGNVSWLLRAQPGSATNLTWALESGMLLATEDGKSESESEPEPQTHSPEQSLRAFLENNGYSRYGTLSGNLIATAPIPWDEHVYVFFNSDWNQQLWASRLVGRYSVITERPHPMDAKNNTSFTSLWYWNWSGWSSKSWTTSFCLSWDGSDGATSTLWISCPWSENPETTNWSVLYAGKANWGNWRLAFLNHGGTMTFAVSPNDTWSDIKVAVYVK